MLVVMIFPGAANQSPKTKPEIPRDELKQVRKNRHYTYLVQ